ncbi:hypothetical protein MYU51_021399 [Penicillium brevicompactum]
MPGQPAEPPCVLISAPSVRCLHESCRWSLMWRRGTGMGTKRTGRQSVKDRSEDAELILPRSLASPQKVVSVPISVPSAVSLIERNSQMVLPGCWDEKMAGWQARRRSEDAELICPQSLASPQSCECVVLIPAPGVSVNRVSGRNPLSRTPLRVNGQRRKADAVTVIGTRQLAAIVELILRLQWKKAVIGTYQLAALSD